ncbi:MAG: polysaccharide deacetylase family protein [Saprospiraceae bacterium]
MKSFLLSLSFCVLFSTLQAQQKEICITIDDLPVVYYAKKDTAGLRAVTHGLIATFDAYDIPAIGYVNERKLFTKGKPNAFQISLLEDWLKSGYELGNHTFGHPSYHEVGYEKFTADVLKGAILTKPLVEKYGKKYEFFRHPYLRVGLRKSAHDSLSQFLELHQYREAPVTIDNDDYLFAKAYHIAHTKGKTELTTKIGKDYVDYMERKLLYFEASADSLFQRPIKQILLLHANLLNAHYLDDLAQMYQAHGYRFIDQATALEDPCYESKITRYGDWGISWLDRWALSKGKKGAFFKGDPPTPEYIKELAN